MWKACCLVKEDKLSAEDFVEAVWRHFKSRPPLGEVAVKEGYLTMSEIFTTLNRQAEQGTPFGETAVQLGFLSTEQLASILLKQEEMAMPVEQLLPAADDLLDEESALEDEPDLNLLAGAKVSSLGGTF